MKRLRVAVAAVLAMFLLVPILLPILVAARSASEPATSFEVGRITSLAINTIALAAGACLIAVPVGTATAIALERIDFLGRRLLRAVILIGLFIPLPVYAVAWQVVLGAWLPPLTLEPGEVAWRPWNEGLAPAAWVHGMAGLPWVVWIVSAGLRSADPGLEEDALLSGGPRQVLRRVVLPRAALASVAAAGWVVVQAATEIPVTDAMMVRTFAEEVYTQLVSASNGVAAAVAVAAPAWIAAIVLGMGVARSTVRAFDGPATEAGRPLELRIPGWQCLVAGLGVWCVVFVFAGLPVLALLWKAGGGGARGGWEATQVVAEYAKVVRTDGAVLVGSVGTALATGFIAAGSAWVVCWLAANKKWFARFLFVLCVVLAVTPGPLVGMGLKGLIRQLVEVEAVLLSRSGIEPTFPPIRSTLYDQPSPVPAGWAGVIRFFPVAVVVLWPVLRAIPRDLLEAAKLDGLGPSAEWRLIVAPLTVHAAARAALAVAALALGEVSAGKLVNPPSRPAFVFRLFDQMHYGAEPTVAALCLLHLSLTASVAGLVLWASGRSGILFTRARSG